MMRSVLDVDKFAVAGVPVPLNCVAEVASGDDVITPLNSYKENSQLKIETLYPLLPFTQESVVATDIGAAFGI